MKRRKTVANKYVDITAIMQVIGSVFNNPQLLDFTDKYTINDEDFPDQFHKIAFGAIYKLHELGVQKISLENIVDFLQSRPKSLAIFQQQKGEEFNKISISCVDLTLIKTITISDLYAYMVFCKNERGNNTATRARKTSTLRIFFKYMCEHTHQLDQNPALLLESPKVKQSLPKHLTLEDSLELLNSVDGANQKRDYCILTLFLNCGLRLAELCSLNVSDVKPDATMVVTGKGNKERLIYLNDACMKAIKDYLAVRPCEDIVYEDRNALFISRNHKRISPKTVQHLVKTFLEKVF